MRDVDYVKLSEQYASFLIAIGGVSITVLSIVSTIGSPSTKVAQGLANESELTKYRSLFLSAALIVSTVCCFIGAHMMAETAAFIKHFKELRSNPPEGSPGELSSLTATPPVSKPGTANDGGKHPFKGETTKETLQQVAPSEESPSEANQGKESPSISRLEKATEAIKSFFNRLIEIVKFPFNWLTDKLAQKEPAKESILEWEPSEAIDFGTRLFLLASTTIFIAVILVLFSIVLLPAVSRGDVRISPIYSIIFVSVGIGTLLWMILASQFRMPMSESLRAILIAIASGLAWGLFLNIIPVTNDRLLMLTFLPIVLATVLSFVNFAWIFKDSNKACKRTFFKNGYKLRTSKVCFYDVCFFGSAVTVSYASLVVAGIKLEALTFIFGT